MRDPANGSLQQPVQGLSRERPLPSILSFYVLSSILLQFAIHMVSMFYITELAKVLHEYVISST